MTEQVFKAGYIDIIAALIAKSLPEGYECRWELMNFDRTVGFAVMTKVDIPGSDPVWGLASQFGWVGRSSEDDIGRQGPAFSKENLLKFIDHVKAEIAKR